MEFRISRQDLLAAIGRVSPALDDGKVIPIYADILIDVFNNGIRLSTNSVEMQMKTFHPLTSVGGASFGVNGKLFTDIIKNLPDGDITFTISETNTLKMSIGRKRLNLNIRSADDFPLAPKYEDMVFTPMPGFMEDANSVMYAVGEDITKPHCMCIYVNNEEFVASDGYRLALRTHPHPIKGEFLIPAKPFAKLLKVFGENVEVFLDMESDRLHLKYELTVCSLRTMARQFLPYKTVIPTGGHDVAIINKMDFLEALKLMGVVHDKQELAVLDFTSETLKIMKRDRDVGDMEDTLPINFTSAVDLGINLVFMSELLSRIKGDTINLEVYSKIRPVAVREGRSLHVLMPIKYVI